MNNPLPIGNYISCAIYARVSTEMQEQSLENQVAFAHEYISRMGEEFVTDESLVYQDFDQSGYYTRFVERDAVKRALDDAKNGRFKVIVFKEVSRVTRDQAEHLEVIGRFQQFGVRVIAINDNIDTDKPESLDFLGIRAWMSEMESKRTSSRVSSARKSIAKRGDWVGEAPIGYRLNTDKKRLEVDEYYADIVRSVFDLYVNHGYGTFKVAEHLNQNGLLSKNDNKWTRVTINRLLKNPAYIGRTSFGRSRNTLKRVYDEGGYSKRQSRVKIPVEQWVVVENTHPAIIDEITFKRAQEIISRRSKQNPRRTKHPLTGILKCGKCGEGMICQKRSFTQKNGTKAEYRYYVCSSGFRFGRSTCDQENIKAEVIEKAIWELLIGQLQQEQNAEREISEKSHAKTYKKRIEKLEAELKKQQVGLTRLLTTVELPESVFGEMKTKFVKALHDLEQEISIERTRLNESANKRDLADKAKNWLQEMYGLDLNDLDRSRAVFHDIVESIVVKEKRVESLTLRYY